MDILVLGGTGAMGKPVVEILAKRGDAVFVTTRKQRTGELQNITYLVGDAHNKEFLTEILHKRRYGAIIDFMVYTSAELKDRMDLILSNTDQYVFLSSSRVYADTGVDLITEKSQRLLDVCDDKVYLQTDEYALAKGREEDLLMESGKKNYTIIRPYITYNDERLQLGAFEKEVCLQRALKGKKIIFSIDMAEKYTTLTYGNDVAKAICNLLGNGNTLGEIFNVVSSKAIRWEDVLRLYLDAIEEVTGKRPEAVVVDNCDFIIDKNNYYQAHYDRLVNRQFDNYKIKEFMSADENFTDADDGLRNCLVNFLSSSRIFSRIDWTREALMDRLSGDRSEIVKIPGLKNKLKYIVIRDLPMWMWGYRVYHR